MATRKTVSGPTSPRVALTVLGMHRSGTSILTKVLSLLGCDLPQTMMGPSENNKTGYWESRAVQKFNDRLLTSARSNWSDWDRVPENWIRSPKAAEYSEEAAQLLDSEFGASRFFVMKDPRISRLVPFWFDVLRDAGVVPHVVLALRNPVEVAESLERRNGFSAELSHLLWLRHMLQAEYDTRGNTRVVVRYEDMLNNWAGTVTRIGEALELSWPRTPAQISAEVEAILSPDHRHHVHPDADLLSNPVVSEWLRDTYRILLGWAQGTGTKADQARLDDIRTQIDTAAPAFVRLVDELQTTRNTLNKKLKVIEDGRDQIKTVVEEQERIRREYKRELGKVEQALKTERETRQEFEDRAKRAEDTAETHEKAIGELQDATEKLRGEMKDATERSETQAREQAEAIALHTRAAEKMRLEIEAAAEQAEAEIARRAEALAAQTRTTEALHADLEAETTRADQVQTALSTATTEIGTLRDKLAETQSAMAQKTAELEDTSKALNTAEKQRAQLVNTLAILERVNSVLKLEAESERVRSDSLGRERTLLSDALSDHKETVRALQQRLDQTAAQLARAETDATARENTHAQTLHRLRTTLDAERYEGKVRLTARHSELAQLTQLISELEAAVEREQRHLAESEADLNARHAEDREAAQTALLLQQATLQDVARISGALLAGRRGFRTRARQHRRDLETLYASGLFDAAWYGDTNPDVTAAGMDPAEHYIAYGLAEARAPRKPFLPAPPATEAGPDKVSQEGSEE